MARQHKTSGKYRTQYIYFSAEGEKIVITPGENGVTEADVELLHTLDDTEVNEQRRYDYRIAKHLDACRDKDGEEAADRNKRLADCRTNPEVVFISREEDAAYEETLFRLSQAMDSLQPQQRSLFEKKYISRRSNTDIATEENVTEAAIRNRLKKIHQKLRKYFP